MLIHVSYQPKESLTVARFDGYWDQRQAAKPQTVTFRYIPDATARLLALQAGDVDIIQDTPLEQLCAVQADNRVKIVASPVGAYETLSVNISGANGTETTQSLVVRQVIAKAIDLVSGFPTPDVHRPLPEVLQQQLRAVGIEVMIVEATDYVDALAKTTGHLYLEKGNQNDADPAFPPRLFASPALDPGNDYGRLFGPGPALDQQISAARRTGDLDKLRDLSAKSVHELENVSVTIIPIAGLTNVWSTARDIAGFAPHSAFVHTSFASVTRAG